MCEDFFTERTSIWLRGAKYCGKAMQLFIILNMSVLYYLIALIVFSKTKVAVELNKYYLWCPNLYLNIKIFKFDAEEDRIFTLYEHFGCEQHKTKQIIEASTNSACWKSGKQHILYTGNKTSLNNTRLVKPLSVQLHYIGARLLFLWLKQYLVNHML
jgi:hypothetical protein